MIKTKSNEPLYKQIEDYMQLIQPIRESLENYKREKTIPRIYHYTRPNGLLGILTDKAIWATDYRFLNDKSELKIATNLANQILLEQLNAQNIPDSFYITLKKAVDYVDELSVFIASFSERGNLLSQWRAYASPQGYSIGINPNIAEYIVTYMQSYAVFSKCIYSSKDQKDIIKNAIEYLHKKWEQKQNDKNYIKKIERAFTDFISVASCFFKHKGFSEEKEWRIAILIESTKEQMDLDEQKQIKLNMKFRPTNSGVAPYILVPLTYVKFSTEEGHDKLKPEYVFELEEIIIGPSENIENQIKSLKALIKESSINVKSIKSSNIPLRL